MLKIAVDLARKGKDTNLLRDVNKKLVADKMEIEAQVDTINYKSIADYWNQRLEEYDTSDDG